MRRVVLIPWRAGNQDREKAMAFVVHHYNSAGFRIVVGDSDTPRFSRTAARNFAADAAEPWDVAAFIDADCVIHPELLEHAMDFAVKTDQVILPHDDFLPLSQAGTEVALEEPNILLWDEGMVDWPARTAVPRKRPSGVVVFSRPVWAAVGGYDERFTGWGFEDTAMLWSLELVANGWRRIAGRLWHLWHPPSDGTWLPEDKALFERYKQAHASEDHRAMRALLDERWPVTMAVR